MKAAVIEGCYVDLKFMPGLKSSRISIDIPIEYSNEFLKMFDAPDRANPVRVAIARLTTTIAEPLPAPEGAATQEKPRTSFKDLPRSQQAALKCQDPVFRQWLFETFRRDATDLGSLGRLQPDAATHKEGAATLLRSIVGIESRSELDGTANPDARDHFDQILTDFDTRGYRT